MGRSLNLVKRLHEVLLDGKWIANTNIKLEVEKLNWKQATRKVNSFNTIAALTFHVNYFIGGINNVFRGGDLEIRDKYSFDIPDINSESDWKNLIDDYLKNSIEFISHVEGMTDSKLDSPFVMQGYGTFERNIEGVIEHSYYHLGQMALISKLL